MQYFFATKKCNAVSAGMRAKAASGFVVGAARIGYVAVRTERGVGTVPEPVMAPFLRKALLMARSGTPVRLIAAWLRELFAAVQRELLFRRRCPAKAK